MDWEAAKEALKQKVNSVSDKEIKSSISSNSLKERICSKANGNKKPYSQKKNTVGYSHLLGQSVKSIANICDVTPQVIIRLLQQKHFEVDNADTELTLNQLSAIQSYIENRLCVIKRKERTDKNSRPSDVQVDVKIKHKGSVFAISAQIRN